MQFKNFIQSIKVSKCHSVKATSRFACKGTAFLCCQSQQPYFARQNYIKKNDTYKYLRHFF